ncbi:membrane protein insertase YidC [Acidimicrobiaceae bacterium USS-CC1]|uniref:Membrane protein insertase YidC n=1 Tax=Acidiferrimicrobium australe TaxID=2664430 RepID=A0ABW9QZ27_9ACTN|nr:membrane protein insertase YidC [Acidiferrimicrobium australe]
MTPHLLAAATGVHAAVHSALHAAAASCPYPTKVSGHSIFGPIARPLAAVLAWFYSLVPNYAFAIICVSVAWAIIIAPLTLKSTRSMLAMQHLQPQMKKLQAEHKNDRQALNQAMMDLYKQEGVSPLGGCLPMLLPFPVFIALFDVINGLSYTHVVNGVRCPDPRFLSPDTAMFHDIFAANGHLNAFGLDLAKNALSSHPSFLAALPYFVLLLVMIGTQYLQSAQMYARNPNMADNPQAKMMKYLPIVFGIIFIRFPAGVILYYAASSILRILQQTLMYRFDPAVLRLANRDVRAVEQEIDDIEAGRRKRVPTTGRGGATKAPSKEAPTKPAGGPGARFREALARQQEAIQERARSQQRPAGGKTTSGGGKATGSGGTRGAGQKPAQKTSPPKTAGQKAATPPAAKATEAKPTAQPSAPAPAGDATKQRGRAPAPPPSTKSTADTGKPGRAAPTGGAGQAPTPGNGNGAPAPAEPAPNGNGAPPAGSRTGSRTGATSNRPTNPAGSDRKRRGR